MRLECHLSRLVGKPVSKLCKRVCTETVGFDNVCTCLDITAVYVHNDIRSAQVEQFVVSPVRFPVRDKALDHRAHSAVKRQDALRNYL